MNKTDLAKLAPLSEPEIDISDIPPLTEDFFNKSRWWKPVSPLNALLRVDPQTLLGFNHKAMTMRRKWQQHYEFMQKSIEFRITYS
jgi:hypothetical protein